MEDKSDTLARCRRRMQEDFEHLDPNLDGFENRVAVSIGNTHGELEAESAPNDGDYYQNMSDTLKYYGIDSRGEYGDVADLAFQRRFLKISGREFTWGR